MAIEYYNSELTGPELDELLRRIPEAKASEENIANLKTSIERLKSTIETVDIPIMAGLKTDTELAKMSALSSANDANIYKNAAQTASASADAARIAAQTAQAGAEEAKNSAQGDVNLVSSLAQITREFRDATQELKTSAETAATAAADSASLAGDRADAADTSATSAESSASLAQRYASDARQAVAGLIRNPNLLDNAWFINPINQRGQTIYTQTGIGYTYGIDRWQFLYYGGKMSLTAQGLTVEATDGTAVAVAQPMEHGEYNKYDTEFPYRGKTATLSVLQDGTVYSTTFTFPSTFAPYGNTNVAVCNINGAGVHVYFMNNRGVRIRIYVPSGGSVTVQAIKLELGSESTLEYDEAPDYATELLKCQRYYRKISSYYKYLPGVVYDSTRAYFAFPIQSMRAEPTVVLTAASTWRVRYGSTSVIPSAIEGAVSVNLLQITATISGATAGQGAFLYFNNPCTIELSADL